MPIARQALSLAALLCVLTAFTASARADEWQVRCDRHGVCALRVGSRRVSLRGEAGTHRGRLRCAERGPWLACAWRHTTQLHLSEAYFVHLPTGRVWPMDLRALAADAAGEPGYVRGAPRWRGARVRLGVQRGARQSWIWRRPPRVASGGG